MKHVKEWEDERRPLNREKFHKGLGKGLIAQLEKTYKPYSRYDMLYRGNDLTFLTNAYGEAVTVFIGKRKEDGDIVGDQYCRRIKKREDGIIKQSHWDNKGRVSRSRS